MLVASEPADTYLLSDQPVREDGMPTLLKVGPYRFFIVMMDCEERRHVHVKGGGSGEAKFWLEPDVELAANQGYTPRETGRIARIVGENVAILIERWNEECAKAK